jgi:beta-lactamase class A
MWQKYSKYIFLLGALFVGAFLTWFWFVPSLVPNYKEACREKYPFISKGVDCETIDDKADQVENLHSDISQTIEKEKADHHIIRASVFYRDLDTKRWFGINDNENFYPASLIKLPIAITYYKIAELEPVIFDKQMQIPLDAGDNSDQYYPPADPLMPGQSYTVREMIRHMLVYSDNAPFTPLSDAAGVFRDKVIADLGITQPRAEAGAGAWVVTTRNYAGIFRMLFNASYLNINYSNELLDVLSQASFTKGLVAGVPEGIKVAHKFGEAVGTDANDMAISRTLHDCGIIYKPKAPYILCTMVEGQDYSQMEQVIKEITQESYTALE